ncbi:SDR family NAD(P)-dependent oxidoreductase [Pediococcus inopinatus]|uniref:SDR family NAD(P)-dependent oxidoreductase n=1 Tax=Pediococcus inopinatus TaxID=114090 RepID=A0ABZ0Q5A7_9LACO|nr:SDR family NAD(P)-dependent oxidoreductase [Pediococcus inopinatus]AVL00873.1 glucose dehydrogenase [Pediococcus inopinatus]KRN61568.1 hypothetical protein IV83_GL000762 [Pediococcus inopinatus]WPC16811.1 SDR family NAD(P)-dependent oxidoreductase [Pediococcus inopinatus]WPC20065.1 SDR family NAD(P)-dependent oxidoreductase [Pediococcus inopinatus]WPC21768.1 SDR family NAD(P)-dependent oxidoreductase [Pediococcus inopinatus]
MKTIMITGGNSGLGFECAKHIAEYSDKYQIILACRNEKKADTAKAILTKETGNPNILAMKLDVSSLASVRGFVAQYKEQKLPLLDGLICNAGISGSHTGQTADGFDIVFETNHLGHFLLTNLLLPYMETSAKILVVSSDMHCPPGPKISWPGTAMLAKPDEKLAKSFKRYSYSKLCNLYFVYELSKRLTRIHSAITVNAFNPGFMVDTNFMSKKLMGIAGAIFAKIVDRDGSLDQSSTALAELAMNSDDVQVSGKYYDRSTHLKRTSELSYNTNYALELWNRSVVYTKLSSGETLPGLLEN